MICNKCHREGCSACDTYSCVVVQLASMTKRAEEAERDRDELREMLIVSTPADLVGLAETKCVDCGSVLTARLGTELKFSADRFRHERDAAEAQLASMTKRAEEADQLLKHQQEQTYLVGQDFLAAEAKLATAERIIGRVREIERDMLTRRGDVQHWRERLHLVLDHGALGIDPSKETA